MFFSWSLIAVHVSYVVLRLVLLRLPVTRLVQRDVLLLHVVTVGGKTIESDNQIYDRVSFPISQP